MSESNTDPSSKPNTKPNNHVNAEAESDDVVSNNGQDVLSQLDQLRSEAEKFKNEFLYLRAEFENYKRNSIKERSDLLKFGAERFIRDFLGSMDNFDRALSTQVTAENYVQFVQGVQMTAKQMSDLLAKHNVIEIQSDHKPFDPLNHEAVGTEVSDQISEGHVVRTLQKAYKMNDKLIRPAQVIVAKKA
ncbi:MAG: nucleotide exchange factor GrpE [Pseudobdellovibrionaceae bacterium]|jgi:molecular chaperone GrpE